MRTWNATKLLGELIAAGIPAEVVGSDGTATFTRTLTASEQSSFDAIVAAHDPAEYSLSPSLQVIRGNGAHEAYVSIQASGSSAALLVNGSAVSVALVNGAGTLRLVSDTAGAEITVTGASGGLAACLATIYVV